MRPDAERKIIGNLDDLGAVNADNCEKTAGLEHLAGTSPGFWAANPNDDRQLAQLRNQKGRGTVQLLQPEVG